MSAVLGPIHEWMYNKVIIQERIIKTVIDLALTLGWESQIAGKNISEFTQESFPPLNIAIDINNIHASLSGLIDDVETRYAVLVSSLINFDNSRLDAIENAVFKFGQASAIGVQSSADDAYNAINGMLLDGMPCDHSMMVTESNPIRVRVTRTLDMHSQYWLKAGSNGDVYYRLRAAFIRGVLSGSGYTFNENGDGNFEIA